MPSGATVVANYLPGYPLLLVPLIWIWGSALGPLRLFSTLCTCALYPLLWAWMGRPGGQAGPAARRPVPPGDKHRPGHLLDHGHGRGPLLLVLVLALLALDHWERQPGWRWASVVIVLLAFLVWLKEAGIGLAVGLVLYELWRRRWRRAAARGRRGRRPAAARVGGPAWSRGRRRWATATRARSPTRAMVASPTCRRGRLGHLGLPGQRAAPVGAADRAARARGRAGPRAVTLVGWTVPVLCVVGAVAWYRRHPRGDSWMVWAYFAETLAYAYTNQRRVILVLPVVVLWYVVGACVTGRALLALGGRSISRAAVALSVVVAVLAAGVPTAFGFTQDYLYGEGQQSSEFAHSPAMALLKALGTPSSVVETDYRGSVAYFTGHRTAWTAFTATTPFGPFAANRCSVPAVKSALAGDDAKFLTIGDFNLPWEVDSPCLLAPGHDPADGGRRSAPCAYCR